VAERHAIADPEGRRPTIGAPPPRGRLAAANDNTPPVRHLVAKLAIAGSTFAATFGVALWWLA